ncbi:DUF1194 domain-containing protein [Maritimibacter sp. DP1N21-5]|uniref:DUF1194 domain-containing protein n=1 Tax=Maritimibacter sp. DP1N21-5 TaxID=2836867 RepID=UPI001C480628|nr:DUF1194 domain-containing protein [Maritimibacter sp. DP1N21-5]MBV7410296.1 DUF1194 domain-containing protein [Maritimibacter sp. DP1N21-5]
MSRSIRNKAFLAASAFSLASSLTGFALAQDAGCRQALALALDVSGSVDANEYRLQLDGLAAALTAPDVRDAILSPGAAPIALNVFEWSGPSYQRTLVDWTLVDDAGVLGSVTETLHRTERQPAPPSTALGTAMAVGVQVLQSAPPCWRATLDISGDGKSNTGPRPQDLDSLPAFADVTINGLVILTIDGMGEGPGPEDLVSYYENLVIRGPDAFVEIADGFEDYERAMRRKLLREIKALAVGALPPGGSADKAESLQ